MPAERLDVDFSKVEPFVLTPERAGASELVMQGIVGVPAHLKIERFREVRLSTIAARIATQMVIAPPLGTDPFFAHASKRDLVSAPSSLVTVRIQVTSGKDVSPMGSDRSSRNASIDPIRQPDAAGRNLVEECVLQSSLRYRRWYLALQCKGVSPFPGKTRCRFFSADVKEYALGCL